MPHPLPPPLFVSSCDSEGGRGPGETTQKEEEEEEGDAVRLDKCLLDRWGGGRGSPPPKYRICQCPAPKEIGDYLGKLQIE